MATLLLQRIGYNNFLLAIKTSVHVKTITQSFSEKVQLAVFTFLLQPTSLIFTKRSLDCLFFKVEKLIKDILKKTKTQNQFFQPKKKQKDHQTFFDQFGELMKISLKNKSENPKPSFGFQGIVTKCF